MRIMTQCHELSGRRFGLPLPESLVFYNRSLIEFVS